MLMHSTIWGSAMKMALVLKKMIAELSLSFNRQHRKETPMEYTTLVDVSFKGLVFLKMREAMKCFELASASGHVGAKKELEKWKR